MNKLFHFSKRFLSKNGTTILAIASTAGVIATAIISAKATPKALSVLSEAESNKGEELTTLEKVKIVAPIYIPTALVGASTVLCIVGANLLDKRKQASLTSAYALVNSSYKQYKDKLKELYGEEVHNDVVNAIAIEKTKDVKIRSERLLSSCDLGDDETSETRLFYDEFSGRYFESTMNKVIQAEYHFNRNFVLGGYVVINDFYELLGLSKIQSGDELGWSAWKMAESGMESWIDFNHRKTDVGDGLECYVIEMILYPETGYLDD